MTPKKKKPIPFEFMFEELAELDHHIKPMFGCHAFYVGHRIYFIARNSEKFPQDNGIWLAFPDEDSRTNLKNKFPILRDISIFGPGPTGWQNLPSDQEEFESVCFEICELIKNEDPRVGKITFKKKSKKKTKKKLKKKA